MSLEQTLAACERLRSAASQLEERVDHLVAPLYRLPVVTRRSRVVRRLGALVPSTLSIANMCALCICIYVTGIKCFVFFLPYLTSSHSESELVADF